MPCELAEKRVVLLGGDDDHTVRITVDVIAGAEGDISARYGDTERAGGVPARRRGGAGGCEDREAERLDCGDIADGAVDNGAGDAALERQLRHLVPPECARGRAARGDDDH